MDQKEIKENFESVTEGYKILGQKITAELEKRLKKPQSFICRNVGNECFGARPSVRDIILARDLGFGATRFLLEGGTGCMITLQAGRILALSLKQMVDSETGRPKVRLVDKTGISYQVAQNYMIKLRKEDLKNPGCVHKMSKAAGMTVEEFLGRFSNLAS